MAQKAAWKPQNEALRILGDDKNESERTFIFRDEDHTLGNALRHVIMQECGLSLSCGDPA